MEFWKNLEGKVSNAAGIPTEIVKDNLQKREDFIIDYLAHACYPEHTPNPEISFLKENIFSLYVNDIALLISKIEVYSHTLSSNSVEGIFNLLQYYAASELSGDIASQKSGYEKSLSFTQFLKYSLQKKYYELLLERLQAYRKMIKDYEHSGVLVEGKPFLAVIDSLMKPAKQQYYSARSVYRKCLRYSFSGVEGIYLDRIPNDMGFSSPIEALENAQELFVQYLPHIIGNGYKRSFLSRVFFLILDSLSAFYVFKWLFSIIA